MDRPRGRRCLAGRGAAYPRKRLARACGPRVLDRDRGGVRAPASPRSRRRSSLCGFGGGGDCCRRHRVVGVPTECALVASARMAHDAVRCRPGRRTRRRTTGRSRRSRDRRRAVCQGDRLVLERPWRSSRVCARVDALSRRSRRWADRADRWSPGRRGVRDRPRRARRAVSGSGRRVASARNVDASINGRFLY